MKYFTHEWWIGAQKGVYENRHAAYADHVGRIRNQVPEVLLELQGKLHDALITSVFCNAEEQRLTLCLDGDREGELMLMQLTYLGLKAFSITPNPGLGLDKDYGFGQLGYDEVDVDSTGVLVHRLLFATGVEVEIRFDGFDYEEKEVASGRRE